MPEFAASKPRCRYRFQEILDILRQRWGKRIDLALSPRYTNPDALPEALPFDFRSPVAKQPNGDWLRHANLVGVNLRTVGAVLGPDPLCA